MADEIQRDFKHFSFKLYCALVGLGITPREIKRLANNQLFFSRMAMNVATMIHGFDAQTMPNIAVECDDSHLVDLAAPPTMVGGYEPFHHCIEIKSWQFDISRIDFHQIPQPLAVSPSGQAVLAELTSAYGERLPNSNVLDFLLQHRVLMPREWDELCFYAFGTVLMSGDGLFWVRGLHKVSGDWSQTYERLDREWRPQDLILVYRQPE